MRVSLPVLSMVASVVVVLIVLIIGQVVGLLVEGVGRLLQFHESRTIGIGLRALGRRWVRRRLFGGALP